MNPTTPIRSITPEERFWSKVRVGLQDECWPWQRARDRGYGTLYFNGRMRRAHRIAYELFHKTQVSLELMVCHKCDNPPCCNPAHLFLGNHSTNAIDAVIKGRVRPPRYYGEQHPRAKLTWKSVNEIRQSDETLAVLAKRYGVDISTVADARRQLTWRKRK